MFLHNFINSFEETQAKRRVRDYLTDDENGEGRVEFLGHYLKSVFQPIYKIHNNRLTTVGYEAFVRPVAGEDEIAPLQFFEDLDPDDRNFVDRLCRELHVTNFLRSAASTDFISINIATSTLEQHADQIEDVKRQIAVAQKNGLSTNRIRVEIGLATELDPGIVYTFAARLKEFGIGVTLEDFDADSASFSRVIYARPDFVKFNRSWLNANLTDRHYLDLVSAIVAGLRGVGVEPHLERIENQQEFNFAIACGFRYMQGFYLGSPDTLLQKKVF